jgi:hypothetical protein
MLRHDSSIARSEKTLTLNRPAQSDEATLVSKVLISLSGGARRCFCFVY